MSSFRVIIITVMVIMVTPAAASAAPIPWGQQFCSPSGTCVTPTTGAQADGSSWVFRWGTAAPQRYGEEWYLHFTFDRFHRYRQDYDPLDSFERVSGYGAFHDNGSIRPVYGSWGVELHPEFNNPDCGALRESTSGGAPTIEGAGPGVANNPEMRHACHPSAFGPSGEWLGATGTTPTESTPAVARVATCAPITYARKRVAVTSAGLQCSSARVVLARFMRTGAKPRGWACRRMARAATCATTSRSRASTKRIVGRWR